MNEKFKELFMVMSKAFDMDQKLAKIIVDDCEDEKNIDKWIKFFKVDDEDKVKCGFHIDQPDEHTDAVSQTYIEDIDDGW